MPWKKHLKKMIRQDSPSIIWLINRFSSNSHALLNNQKGIHSSVVLRQVQLIDCGNNNRIQISAHSRLNQCEMRFYGNNNYVNIDEGCLLNQLTIWIEDDANIVSIGANTTVNGYTQMSCIEGKTILIGEDCMFSSSISLRTGDSHSIINSQGERVNIAKDVCIGNHVWIGQNVFIGKGANIGQGSIVGACAVVTRSFDKQCVVLAGNPAEIVKEDVEWKRERIQESGK